MIFEADDFGCDHVISDMCQSHDCRDVLLELKKINPAFKATLFAIPGEMTFELLNWCRSNKDWIELAVHGIYHGSNYECEKLSYHEFGSFMKMFEDRGILDYFVKGFRAPGWQIGKSVYWWLENNGYWVADQGYNDTRRPMNMSAYINNNGQFRRHIVVGEDTPVEAYHGHCWNVGSVGSTPNGIYEDFDTVEKLVREAKDFQFVSELFT